MRNSLKRYDWLGVAAVAVALAGCKPSQPSAAPQATAPAVTAAPAPQPAPAPTVTPEEQKVEALIKQVEIAYARGEVNYRKGKLAEAKTQFDHAVDLMLTSGVDLKSNAKLQEEFDRIIDGVNALEMEALKQGNGFVLPEEPTPADVASEVTFEVDPNIVAKAKADLATTKSDLPLMVNDYVAVYINFFANTQKGHNTLLHSFQRAGRYKTMIQSVMAEEGVPQDMIYLAVAESGFNPRALNGRSGAGGMWQFMPYGNYGLKRTAYVDERFDPEKSTRAAARYMKFIYDQLGDWYLAMAGYNWGTGNVQRAVQKTGYADFWELYKRHNLPAETQNYVPEILAAIIIANNPTQYGFDEITLDAPVLTDTVAINYQVDLRLVGDIVGAPMEEMKALNPSLLRTVTPPDSDFDLHLPAGTAGLFEKQVALVPENRRNAWRYHRVKQGETLASVAKEHRVSVADLAEANQKQEDDSLDGVEALVVPAAFAASSSSSSTSSSPSPSRSSMYTVRKGETLVTIADRFGVSLDQLRRWNNMSGTKVRAGRRLHVTETASSSRASRSDARRKSSAKARKSSAQEKSSAKSSSSASSKKGKTATKKGSSSGAGKARAKSAKSASEAKKNESSSAGKRSSTKSKSSARKQK